MLLLILVYSFLALKCQCYSVNGTWSPPYVEDHVPNSYNSSSIDRKDMFNEPSIYSLMYGESKETSSNSSNSKTFIEKAESLSMCMRHMVNIELGVSNLQEAFNSLPYVDIEKNPEKDVLKMVTSLEGKLGVYRSILKEMSDIVRESYGRFLEMKKEKLKPLNYTEDFMPFPPRRDSYNSGIHHEYYPCCIMADHFLGYNTYYKAKINAELWCDSGLEQDQLDRFEDLFFTPIKLTEAFQKNYHSYPNLKWQFFMSASGGHTEFPAHRPGSSVGSDCGKSSRHHGVYEHTVRPSERNIVVLFDLGKAMRPRLLLTAKAIGYYIVDTLSEKDRIAMLGVGDSVVYPSEDCTRHNILPATHSLKQSLRYFMDYLKIQDADTNHTLGLEAALDLVKSFSSKSQESKILIVYATPGTVNDQSATEQALRVLAERTSNIDVEVFVNAFGIGMAGDDIPSAEEEFLESLVKQEYSKFGISYPGSTPPQGSLIRVPATLRMAPIIKNFYDVVQTPNATSENPPSENVTVSDIYWDTQAKGMVLTLSRAIYGEENELVGVVGLDLGLPYLLEDVTASLSADRSYAFVIDSKGNTIGHPRMGRPDSWHEPLLKTPITTFETSTTFADIFSNILSHSNGKEAARGSGLHNEYDYVWKRSESLGWIFVMAVQLESVNLKKLSSNISSLPSEALFHRLDLLSPQEAKVCRHFNQMATLDGASVFLSFDAYVSPNSYLSKTSRNLNADTNIMAYLMDQTKLVSNPGLRDGVREEASALFQVSPHWTRLLNESPIKEYVVRRYGASFNGIALMYPGTLLDPTFDPKSRKWFSDAVESPGKVIVSPPFLDPGGAGYIVTMSHSVYQGNPDARPPSELPVQAVLAADLTLGFWIKLMVDIEPLCANSVYFRDSESVGSGKETPGVRCFLMDTSGVLVAHPSFVEPALVRRLKGSFPPHVTLQEPVLSIALLGVSLNPDSGSVSEPVLKKIWCSKEWTGSSKRHYQFKLDQGKLFESSQSGKLSQNERSCLQYKLTAVPSSNLILGFINQTCSPAATFCPCSLVDHLCLNCEVMESAACECPCECPLPAESCPGPRDPINSKSGLSDTSGERHFASSVCPRPVEAPVPLQYGVGMLSQLDVCVPSLCFEHADARSCLGIVGCVWCTFGGDGLTPLDEAYCAESQSCYGGVQGGSSPYPTGLAPLPHSKSRGSSLPVGPAAGGALAVFVVLALAVYFYRAYVSSPGPRSFGSSGLHSSIQNPRSYLYAPAFYPDKEADVGEKGEDGLMRSAATMSPYRMNPGYRRPAESRMESSDPGYSTMTPREESERLFQSSSASSGSMDASSDTRCSIDEAHGTCTQCLRAPPALSSPKRIGPNRLIVPVTVHMVDSV